MLGNGVDLSLARRMQVSLQVPELLQLVLTRTMNTGRAVSETQVPYDGRSRKQVSEIDLYAQGIGMYHHHLWYLSSPSDARVEERRFSK